jgi:hypothetical protein
MGQEEKSRATKDLWIGLRCRNASCGLDFPACCDPGNEELIIGIPLDATAEVVGKMANTLLGKLSPALTAISSFHGTKAFASGAINVSPALQHCPHCGRWYLYPYSDYFMTMEDMPKMPE